jgi:hypothetical protein
MNMNIEPRLTARYLLIALISVLALQLTLRGQVSPPGNPAAPVSQWPQRLDSPDGLITIYEPQPTKFEGDTLTARAAVSLTPPGATDPEFGAMWFTARVSTDRDTRIVTIANITIKQVKLPNSAADAESRFTQVLQNQAPGMNLMLSLDQLDATLGVVQKEKQETSQFDTTPPKIVFTQTPTTLVLLDGPPKLQPAQAQGVMTVVNTPFIMLFDGNSKRYFLKAGEFWMVSSDLQGQWGPAGNDVPAGVVATGNAMASQDAATATPAPQPTAPPTIMVAEEPTEVISTQGPPTYTPIVGNDLLYMSNTNSDVFLEVSSQEYFVLLSGRWFASKSLAGGWAYVPADKLPPSFAQIPANSLKANVLVSIPATQQAKDARLDAYIPQTTAIQRSSGADLTVTYDGDPQFVPITDTPITYASNCPDPVLCVDNAYYCCHQAVWYRSGVARGPWAVCDSVPQIIYTLPPSCPVYNCRYVYVYDSTPEVVYCGYLPGYTGCYVFNHTVVYGTGYNYPFWYHSQFIPRPYTWGFAAAYDFNAGAWGFGLSFSYGPTWFANRPERRDWFGPQGYVGYRDIHNRTNVREINVRNTTINRINIYNRAENVKRNIVVHNEVGRNTEVARQPEKRELAPTENNVYAGQNGAIYRRTATGWETRDAKGWSEVKPETVNSHAENIPQHAEEPKQGDIHRDAPVRETPAREPAHVEQPTRVEPGLDEERAARERSAPVQQHAAEQHPTEQHAPEQHAAPGGGGGGGNRQR